MSTIIWLASMLVTMPQELNFWFFDNSKHLWCLMLHSTISLLFIYQPCHMILWVMCKWVSVVNATCVYILIIYMDDRRQMQRSRICMRSQANLSHQFLNQQFACTFVACLSQNKWLTMYYLGERTISCCLKWGRNKK